MEDLYLKIYLYIAATASVGMNIYAYATLRKMRRGRAESDEVTQKIRQVMKDMEESEANHGNI